MIGLLDGGNPPVMSVVELPTGVFVMPRWQRGSNLDNYVLIHDCSRYWAIVKE